ncbi:E3 ubiquitin-protein ligase TRIM39-like [Oncorhynchus kisutch]|uniref:E3 ubiquitin-protein ligase TRIM39-like n=1 Tax=Oncorhynchus kisutch TaxID=8019 RepID=UPI0012DC0083|nr:E3 ubiquitin-protein ligase TRIM39-like [Oncorhynchus kisutch]
MRDPWSCSVREDQACVCQFCTETDHKTHKTVPIEEEYGERKAQMGKSKDTFQKMIQERLKKVKEIEQAVELSKRDAEREIVDSLQVFAALVCCIERNQAELIEVVEEKQKAAERQAERLIEELEQEITELKSRSTELEQLSNIKDHLHLLQSSTSLYTTLPPTKNWSGVHSDLCVGTVRRAVSQLEETLNKEMEMFPQIKLKRMQQCAVDVMLDPDTACPYLILSEDRKEVRYGAIKQELPDNPERFDCHPRVLGMEGFSSGKFYYEVQMKEKNWWASGVARESINRKGMNVLSPEFGAWTIELRNRNEYGARTELVVPLTMREKPQKVGVFVDYKKGQVSFYDVEARSHIYSFTDCTFTERLCPLLSSPDPSGDNSAPLIFSPVMSEFSQ